MRGCFDIREAGRAAMTGFWWPEFQGSSSVARRSKGRPVQARKTSKRPASIAFVCRASGATNAPSAGVVWMGRRADRRAPKGFSIAPPPARFSSTESACTLLDWIVVISGTSGSPKRRYRRRAFLSNLCAPSSARRSQHFRHVTRGPLHSRPRRFDRGAGKSVRRICECENCKAELDLHDARARCISCASNERVRVGI